MNLFVFSYRIKLKGGENIPDEINLCGLVMSIDFFVLNVYNDKRKSKAIESGRQKSFCPPSFQSLPFQEENP